MSKLSNSSYTLTFLAMIGMPRGAGERLEQFARPGEDGQEYRKIGSRGPVYQLNTTAESTSTSNAQTAVDTYEAAKGEVVTVTDDRGQTHANHVIIDVDASIVPIGASAGTSANVTHLIMADWTMQHTGA